MIQCILTERLWIIPHKLTAYSFPVILKRVKLILLDIAILTCLQMERCQDVS